jgi:hypothetical protein
VAYGTVVRNQATAYSFNENGSRDIAYSGATDLSLYKVDCRHKHSGSSRAPKGRINRLKDFRGCLTNILSADTDRLSRRCRCGWAMTEAIGHYQQNASGSLFHCP